MLNGIRCESLGMGVKIFISDEYKFSTDTILLADFCKADKNSLILDIGTGCGTIPLLFCRDGKGRHVTAIDIQEDACKLLDMSVKANGFDDRIAVLNEDIKTMNTKKYGKYYDIIACNPPYKKDGSGLESNIISRKLARNECTCTIDDIILMSKKLLKDNGELFMCSRVERMNEILHKMSINKIEPKLIRLVQQKIFSEPKLFFVKGRKSARSGLRCMPTLIMSNDNGMSEEMSMIYKPFFADSKAMEDKN